MHISESSSIEESRTSEIRFPFPPCTSLADMFGSLSELLEFQNQEFVELTRKGSEALELLASTYPSAQAKDRGRRALGQLVGVKNQWEVVGNESQLLLIAEEYLRGQGFQYELGTISLNMVGWGKDALVVSAGNICARIQPVSKEGFELSRMEFPLCFTAPCLEQAESRRFIRGDKTDLMIEIFPLFEGRPGVPNGAFQNYYDVRSNLERYRLEFADISLPNLTQAALWGQQPVICDPDAVVRNEETFGPVRGELQVERLDQLIELWLSEKRVFSMDPISFHDFITSHFNFTEEMRGVRRRLPLSQIEKRVAVSFAGPKLKLHSLELVGEEEVRALLQSADSWESVKPNLLLYGET